MTFKIKIRGAGGLLASEYRCPIHGVFTVTVQRDENGDPPSHQSCPHELEVHAPECDTALDEACSNEPDCGVWTCGRASEWTISAPMQKVLSVPCYAAVRGGDMKDRPPGMLDTRPLAEGMKYTEWKKLQREETRRRRHKQLVDKGIISKKVIV